MKVIKQFIKDYVKPFIFVSFFLYVVYLIFHPVFVSGTSMEPTLYNGDILICDGYFEPSDLKRNDIVVLFTNDFPERKIVKRLIGMPGDTLVISNGVLYINDKASAIIYEKIEAAGILSEALTLSEDEYFCIGDNVNHSDDCRFSGTVSFDNITHIVSKKIYSKN